MNWLDLASRNLLRNAGRSVTTMAAVTLGYAAVNIFGGFAAYMFLSIRDAYIHNQTNGHVQLWKEGYKDHGGSNPSQYLIPPELQQRVQDFAAKDPRVLLAAGTLEISGSIDVDGVPTFFIGQSMKPSDRERIDNASSQSDHKPGYEGDRITDETPEGIGITEGMARNLHLEKGSGVLLMAPTIENQMNAVDATVFQVIDMPAEALNNRFLYLPLSLAQKLYETGGVTTMRLLLKDLKDSEAVVADLKKELNGEGLDILTWDQASPLYHRTKSMFDIIFGMVFCIIITIVSMSVLNTIGMAVVERTREIGTLRALGLKRPGVIGLFALESGLLGFIGATLGLIITVGFSMMIASIEPKWEPPMIARAVVWEIRLVPAYLLGSFVVLVLLTFAAAILPARRAACAGIVDSLGHS